MPQADPSPGSTSPLTLASTPSGHCTWCTRTARVRISFGRALLLLDPEGFHRLETSVTRIPDAPGRWVLAPASPEFAMLFDRDDIRELAYLLREARASLFALIGWSAARTPGDVRFTGRSQVINA
ncbi:MAG: hypothetical protein EA350_14585 [Gemmatimonadales bacterium]|nr:MAG: hypothetical protein EA350_14585 [Gemmatimonadales bacterium]